jgi:hypothetical protein
LVCELHGQHPVESFRSEITCITYWGAGMIDGFMPAQLKGEDI